MLAERVERAVFIGRHHVAEALLVRRGEVIERFHHPRRADAGRTDRARLVDAGADHDRVVTLAQVFHRGIATDLEILVEDDAAVLEPLDAALDDRLFQLEAWDAVHQQPTHAIVPIIDVYLIAARPHQVRHRQPGGPGADHRDRLALGRPGGQRFDPALLPGGIGDVFLDRADRDRAVAGEFDDAIALAQPVLRADAAADLGHGRGRVGKLIGLAQPPLGGEPQPVRNMIVERAVRRAIRHAALRATRRLLFGLGDLERARDLAEVACALARRALLRIVLPDRGELKHANHV